MKPRRNLSGIHNDFSAVAGGLRRGCILIRNRDWWRSVHLTTCWMLCNIMGCGGVGMMTFRALDNMLDAMQHHGLGWGGDDDVPCTRQHVGCYATSWVVVGWGWWRSVHLTTCWMLCNIMGWGGVGMMTFRALDNMLDAMQHHGLGWGGDDDVPCTWQHVGCYATSWVGLGWGWWRSVHLTTCWMLCNIMGCGGVGMMTFRALDNMLDAMQHHGLGWGGDDDVPCTWQHVGCYATSWVGVGWGWWRSVHLTTFHSTSFGSKNEVVLGTLIWGFLILNYNGNWHSILLPHSSGVIRMLMLKITSLLQRNTNFYKPSIFHGPKTTRPSTRRAPSCLAPTFDLEEILRVYSRVPLKQSCDVLRSGEVFWLSTFVLCLLSVLSHLTLSPCLRLLLRLNVRRRKG